MGEWALAYRTCPLCEASCGLEIATAGDEVVSVRGDADDVFSAGFICPKGVALKQLHDDPDRVRTPLLRQRDAHNLANLLYAPAMARSLGTRNLFSASTLAQYPKQTASALMFGTGTSVPVPDVDRTDYLLILGANPLASNGSLLTARTCAAACVQSGAAAGAWS